MAGVCNARLPAPARFADLDPRARARVGTTTAACRGDARASADRGDPGRHDGDRGRSRGGGSDRPRTDDGTGPTRRPFTSPMLFPRCSPTSSSRRCSASRSSGRVPALPLGLVNSTFYVGTEPTPADGGRLGSPRDPAARPLRRPARGRRSRAARERPGLRPRVRWAPPAAPLRRSPRDLGAAERPARVPRRAGGSLGARHDQLAAPGRHPAGRGRARVAGGQARAGGAHARARSRPSRSPRPRTLASNGRSRTPRSSSAAGCS